MAMAVPLKDPTGGEDSGIDSDSERRQLIDFFGIKGSAESSPERMKRSPSIELDGRDSPPLLEVELTASDEEDDDSVLELVITTRDKKSKEHSVFMLMIMGLLCCYPKYE